MRLEQLMNLFDAIHRQHNYSAPILPEDRSNSQYLLVSPARLINAGLGRSNPRRLAIVPTQQGEFVALGSTAIKHDRESQNTLRIT